MGALCCCFSSDTTSNSFEDYLPYQNGSLWRECSCLRSCVPWFFTRYDEVTDQETVFPSQVAIAEGSNVDTAVSAPEVVFQAPPLPLPYDDSDAARRLRSVARRDKSGMSTHHNNNNNNAGAAEDVAGDVAGDAAVMQRRFLGVDEEGLKADVVEKNHALPSKPPFPKVGSALSMLDDDDVCPTCLDGYTEENPRITTACGHNFHLACIYEWMERSNRCPICDKEMIFSEN